MDKNTFSTFNDVLNYLDSKGLFHIDLSLDRMNQALQKLNLVHLPFTVVQVLGTNGKGSTASFLANICQKHHLRTGLYTSPHFVSPIERIKINGAVIDQQSWILAAQKIRSVAPDLTYFEFLTIEALLLFCGQIDVAILEAGLGGAHDATTATAAQLICYTPIALDHCQVLGATLAQIARDKAKAIHPKAFVCTASQYPDALAELAAAATDAGVVLEMAKPLVDLTGFALKGQHQAINGGLAVLAFQRLAAILGIGIDAKLIDMGLREAFVPGRLQYVAASKQYPAMILDGGHNPHGVQTIIQALRTFPRPAALIYAGLDDKDWPNALRLLAQEYRGKIPAYFPILHNPRASQAAKMHAMWYNNSYQGIKPDFTPKTVNEILAHLLDRQESGYVLVTGSLYLLAEIYAQFPDLLEKQN